MVEILKLDKRSHNSTKLVTPMLLQKVVKYDIMKVQKFNGPAGQGGREMNKRNAQEKQVGKQELMEELLAMIEVCFEGEVKICEDSLWMALPEGESFRLNVEEVKEVA